MAVIKEHPLLHFCLVAMDDEDDEDGDREDDLGVSDSNKALIALPLNCG